MFHICHCTRGCQTVQFRGNSHLKKIYVHTGDSQTKNKVKTKNLQLILISTTVDALIVLSIIEATRTIGITVSLVYISLGRATFVTSFTLVLLIFRSKYFPYIESEEDDEELKLNENVQ